MQSIQDQAEQVVAFARNTFAKAMALNPEALRPMAGGLIGIRLRGPVHGPVHQRQVQGDHQRRPVGGRGTLEMRGSVVAKENSGTADTVEEITFQVANAAGGEAVNLTPSDTIIKYTDVDQTVTLVSGDFTVTGLGNADTDKLVETNEIYEVKITGMVAKLNPDLGTSDNFTLQLIPPQGAVVHIERRTPVLLDDYNDLG